jgi:hypothetical protein
MSGAAEDEIRVWKSSFAEMLQHASVCYSGIFPFKCNNARYTRVVFVRMIALEKPGGIVRRWADGVVFIRWWYWRFPNFHKFQHFEISVIMVFWFSLLPTVLVDGWKYRPKPTFAFNGALRMRILRRWLKVVEGVPTFAFNGALRMRIYLFLYV